MTRISKDTARRIADHWDRRTQEPGPEQTKWWQSRIIRRHINRLVSGEEYGGTGEGWVHVLKNRLHDRVLQRAVSVGSGIGNKEMRFLRLGLVEQFDLFELSEARIARGRELAQRLGLANRVRFRREDAFAVVEEASFDLVHWNNSLHHMLEVRPAVEWSYRVLRSGGVFFMDDYVGPARFQWSDRALAVASGVRAMLPSPYLQDPYAPQDQPRQLPIQLVRPSARRIAREDPSEAADSDKILSTIQEYFPQVEIRLTGGVVYHLALANILHNFDEDDPADSRLLTLLMQLDEACLGNPEIESLYATALAFKPES